MRERVRIDEATHAIRRGLIETFSIGLPDFPSVWSKDTPPDVRLTAGGANAGFGHANHFGQPVLVAGTTEPGRPMAVLVLPPEKVRPIRPDEPWFRARGENNAHLPWWGLRHDAPEFPQGFSR